MTQSDVKCGKCANIVRPLRDELGRAVCPFCANVLSAASVGSRPPGPQPQPVRASAPATNGMRSPAPRSRRPLPMARPSTPDEALSRISSSPWVPENGTASPSSAGEVPPGGADGGNPIAPAAAGKSPWVYYAVGGGMVVALIVCIVVLLNKLHKPIDVAQSNASDSRVDTSTATHSTADQPTTPATGVTASVPMVSPTLAKAVLSVPRVINLLPLIDPARDAVKGVWTMQANGLASDDSMKARLRIPCAIPLEYDFRIEFTRLKGAETVAQFFNDQNHACMWMMDGWKGTVCAFQLISGKAGNNNDSTVLEVPVTANERHTSVVRVRKDYIEASLDGKVISHYATDGSDLRLNADWDLSVPALGVGSHTVPTIFHVIELVDLSK